MSAPKLIAIIAAILFVVLMVIANLGDGSGEPSISAKPHHRALIMTSHLKKESPPTKNPLTIQRSSGGVD